MTGSSKVTVVGRDSPVTFAYSVDYDLFWGLPRWCPSTPKTNFYQLQANADLETVKLFFEHVRTSCPVSLPNMTMLQSFSDLCDEFECHTLKENLAPASPVSCDIQTKRKLIKHEERISELEIAFLGLQAELSNIHSSPPSQPRVPRAPDSHLQTADLAQRIDQIERQNTTLMNDNQALKTENRKLRKSIQHLTQLYSRVEQIVAQQQVLVDRLNDSATHHLQRLDNHEFQIRTISAALDPSILQPPPA